MKKIVITYLLFCDNYKLTSFESLSNNIAGQCAFFIFKFGKCCFQHPPILLMKITLPWMSQMMTLYSFIQKPVATSGIQVLAD